MNLLTKCFQVLSTNKNDSSWMMKYVHRINEEELVRLAEKNSSDDRAASSISFNFESSDDESRSRSRSPRSDRVKKSPTNSPIKQVSTQTPSDILRSSINIPKQRSKSPISTGTVTPARAESLKAPQGVSANRITEKKAYITESSPSEYHEQHRSHSPKARRSNDKSQIVTYSSIIRETRNYQEQQQLADRTSIKDMKEVFEIFIILSLILFS